VLASFDNWDSDLIGATRSAPKAGKTLGLADQEFSVTGKRIFSL